MIRARSLLVALLLSVCALGTAGEALAARLARVDIEGAEIFEGPGKGYRLLEKLPKGAAVSASNVPTEGYYKIRTVAGVVGWISAEVLVIEPESPEEKKKEEEKRADARRYKRDVRLKLLGGANFFGADQVNQLFGIDALQLGLNYGGELQLFLAPWISLGFRYEYVVKSVNASNDTDTFEIDLRSNPVMAGVELHLIDDSMLEFSITGYGGMALQTELVSVASDRAAPNETKLFAHSPTFTVKANVGFNITKSIGLYAEFGYRYLKTAKLTPSIEGDGSDIFRDDPTDPSSDYIPVSINLTGPLIGGGVMLTF